MSHSEYFGLQCDEDAINYLKVSNWFLHSKFANVLSIAEDVSGMPGTCRPIIEAGLGQGSTDQFRTSDPDHVIT